MSWGLDFAGVYRQAATYVDRILRGTKASDLPIQAPNKFELVINLKWLQDSADIARTRRRGHRVSLLSLLHLLRSGNGTNATCRYALAMSGN
jgi:hypothetical protein